MDRGIWRAIVCGDHQRVGHNFMTKQQQTEVFMGKMILWVGFGLK